MRILRFVILALVFLAVVGFVTMFLWNWLVPELFQGPEIRFEQALGLMLLGRLLVGGCHKSPDKDSWKARMKERFTNISEEEKEAFKKRFCDKWD